MHRWAKEAGAFLSTLPEKDRLALEASTPNAHFTSPDGVTALWAIARRLGFRGGRVFDPAMGIGNVFLCAPEDLVRASQFAGVEIDRITGRMAQKIYPDAHIWVGGFESQRFPQNFFDLIITNVPFGNYPVYDPDYASHRLSIHNYFLVRGLDLLKPGGIMVAITSGFTMDSETQTHRRLMAARADLVAAIRQPEIAQEAQAGTQVLTDILVFRKPIPEEDATPFPVIPAEEWMHSSNVNVADGYYQPCNGYWARHPEHVAGRMTVKRAQYGLKLTCVLSEQRPIWDAVRNAVDTLPQIPQASAQAGEKSLFAPEEWVGDEWIMPQPLPVEVGGLLHGSFVRRGDAVHVLDRSASTDQDEDRMLGSPVKIEGKRLARLLGILEVRDALLALYRAQNENGDTVAAREALNLAYDGFVKRFGPLNLPVNRGVFAEDPHLGRVMALERYDTQSRTAAKADVFMRDVVGRPALNDRPATMPEALAASLNLKGSVDVGWISEALSCSRIEVADELTASGLAYKNPSDDSWRIAAAYLSGDVVRKLEEAEAAAALDSYYDANVAALRAVQPAPVASHEIAVVPGAPWIPLEDTHAFIAWLLRPDEDEDDSGDTIQGVHLEYTPSLGEFSLEFGYPIPGYRVSARGTADRDAGLLLLDMLNRKLPRVYDTIRTEDGEKRMLNRAKTLAAQNRLVEIETQFQEWIWSDPQRSERLAAEYNRRFNVYVPPRYDGSSLTLSGISQEVHLRAHQRDGIMRGILEQRALFDHEVGTGKTIVQIATAMELRRLAIAKRPLIAVPNHMLEQFAREAQQLYPQARILVMDKDDLSKNGRAQFVGRAIHNEWDVIVTTHGAFQRLGMRPDIVKRIIDDKIMQLKVDLEASKNRRTQKRIQMRLKTYEAKLEKTIDTIENRKDITYMDEVGVDAIFIDEAHYFKNLGVETTADLGNEIQESQRALDLHLKIESLRREGGAKVFFSTGTPITNNLLEFYNMMRYLAPDILESKGLSSANAWASFLRLEHLIEPSYTGTEFAFKTRQTLVNAPEAIAMYRQVADVVTSEQTGIERPVMDERMEICKRSPAQKQITEWCVERLKDIAQGAENDDLPNDNVLAVITDLRKGALDQRLVYPSAKRSPDGKIATCARRLFDRYRETDADLGVQLVFCDMGTPGGAVLDLYADLKGMLVDKGIDESQIAFIHDAKTDEAKADLFRRTREGQVRVLVGSTDKMGTGTNVQDRVVAMHLLDPTWRPADMTQRVGRGIRQGNWGGMKWGVPVWLYATDSSPDAFLYATLRAKEAAFSRLRTCAQGGPRDYSPEIALDFGQVSALASGNPLMKEKVDIEAREEKLSAARADHAAQARRAEDSLGYLRIARQVAERKIAFWNSVREPKGLWTLAGPPQQPAAWPGQAPFEGPTEQFVAFLRKAAGVHPGLCVENLRGVTLDGMPVTVVRNSDKSDLSKPQQIFWAAHEEYCRGHSPGALVNILRGAQKERLSLQEFLQETQERIAGLERQITEPFPQEAAYQEARAKAAEVRARIEIDMASDATQNEEEDSQQAARAAARRP